jgi:hypothetical protein
MVRRWTVGVLACLAAVPLSLAAGCSEKHQAAQTLPTTASSSATSSAAALPTVGPADFSVPPEARQRTPAGVEAFTRYYIELLNRQLRTLDSTPLRELSRHCSSCTALADSYDRGRAAGHKYEGGQLSVESIGSATVQGNIGETSFSLRQEAVTVRDSSGAILSKFSGTAVSLGGGVRLLWDTARTTWVVVQLDTDKV